MWRLLDLGAVSGYTMTNLYEAVGRAVSAGDAPNTVILNHPEAHKRGLQEDWAHRLRAGPEDFVKAMMKARVETG